MTLSNFTYDADLIEEISSRLELRKPNRLAFGKAITALAGDIDPATPIVLSLATAVGKTYIMAAIIEYLRTTGHTDAIIVTPSTIVQAKTVANFTPGNRKYIDGGQPAPRVITPETYDLFRAKNGSEIPFDSQLDPIQLFIVNVHQLLNNATKLPSERELGGNIKRYLNEKKDLIVLADEHHLYSLKAKAFNDGIMGLDPAAIIGLTASADDEHDDVHYRYTLREAIKDAYVKRPVLAFRRGGYGQHEEDQQLRDALALLRVKKQAFATYLTANPHQPAISPVLYVQCSDVVHATDVTAQLRGSEFFNSYAAVLQVDNEHNDTETIRRLTDIDSVNSPVRCVVSVNKLKEGWDVKNVAVMVTLRAMASEILTQQTLGRGLRLPFGEITGVGHVDQLDIITHESFRKALKNENVLREFGLGAVSTEPTGTGEQPPTHPPHPDTTGPTSGDDTGDSNTGTGQATETDEVTGYDLPIALPGGATSETTTTTGGIGFFEFDDSGIDANTPPPNIETVTMNPTHADVSIHFPTSTIRPFDRALDLTDALHPADITAAAKTVSDSGAILQREELTFTSRQLRTLTDEDVTVDSIRISAAEARAGLIREVLGMSNFDATTTNTKALEVTIVPKFVHDTGITEWSVKALSSARSKLRTLIEDAAKAHRRGLGDTVIIRPVPLPVSTSYSLDENVTILDRLPTDATSADFHRHRHYGPWTRGLFTAASFDSYSTEYCIADMLDRSPSIQWWKRLYASDRATIAYTPTSDYRPDFIALDANGYHWIIEGKADDQETDATVSAKRDATEKLITKMAIDDTFAGQCWGYAIAFEADVKAADSWDDLITSLNPVKTQKY